MSVNGSTAAKTEPTRRKMASYHLTLTLEMLNNSRESAFSLIFLLLMISMFFKGRKIIDRLAL